MDKQILQAINNEIDEKRNKLNLIFATTELHIQDWQVACEISLFALEISKIFGKYNIPLFETAFAVIDKMINTTMFGNIGYHTAISFVVNIHSVIEDALEIFLVDGSIDEKYKFQIEKLSKLLFEDEQETRTYTEERKELEEIDYSQEATSPDLYQLKSPPQDDEFNITDEIQNLDGKFESFNSDMLQFMNDFIPEAEEYLNLIEEQLLVLENDITNDEAINCLFRYIHSIKGTAGFMKLEDITILSHWTETLLDRCRAKKMVVNTNIINILLKSTDTLKNLLANVCARFKSISSGDNPELPEIKIVPVLKLLKTILTNQTEIEEEKPIIIKENQKADIKVLTEEQNENDAVKAVQTTAMQSDFIRVPLSKIDSVSEMVGELLISLSLLKQAEFINDKNQREANEKINSIEMIADLLQSNILKMRMFPIKPVYDKLNRQIRDLVIKSVKKIEFSTFGANVEVDKTVIDEIYSPLSHIIRNSVDHGIEAPDIRIAAGKSETGKVEIITENRGDNVVIKIIDDGGGLNKDKILKKAVQNKLISENDINTLSESQIYNFIFHPGFSTAEKVTEISGRGVGMDVVKKTVEKLGGKIDIQSKPGTGSIFEIILPLSASVIDGLVITLGKSKFIVPILKIKHTLTPGNNSIKSVYSEKGLFIVFENKTAPVLILGDFYKLEYLNKKPETAVILIIEVESKLYGIMVDEILHKQKVVCRRLNETLNNICGVKAATILGDGSVGLIIEPEEIVKENYEL